MDYIQLDLPWPPTVNTYWRKNNRGMYISKRGLEYKKKVFYLCSTYRKFFSKQDRLSLAIIAYPPDKRKRDIDNILKSLIDSLASAKVFENDEQIDEIHIIRNGEKKGKVSITLKGIKTEHHHH